MSQDGFNAFVAALDAPAEPVPAIVDIFRRIAPWEAVPKEATPPSSEA